ncbi:MAG: hypothetical protein WB947_06890 [Thermoplasmata archaeon]
MTNSEKLAPRPDRRLVGGTWTTNGKKLPVPILVYDYELRWVNFQLVGTANQYVTIGSGAAPWFKVVVGNLPVVLRDFNPLASNLCYTDDGNSGNTFEVIGA